MKVYAKQKETGIENKLVVTKGGRKGERDKLEVRE